MRIERLEIAGFKSFPEPVALSFRHGATAVVGPNGCGKSNIADALLWVLGELGAGTIRARGRDLIFSGSALRPPLGVAEIRLELSGVLAAAGGAAANGAADIGRAGGNGRGIAVSPPGRRAVVTRRVDASGQSTFEMDGRRSTRREIQRLFAGTGLGIGSYALIEQGRAHAVLTSKPEDLRLLVEEAVGLGAYRLNRRESESNLRSAERALERVRERLRELDRHIRQARRDSRTASRVREAAEQVRRLGIAEQAARREALRGRLLKGVSPEARLAAERGRRAASLRAFEVFVEQLGARRDRTDRKLREATRRLGDLKSRQAQADAQLGEGERGAALRAGQRTRLEREESDLRGRFRQREEERARSARRAEECPGLLETLTSRVAERAAARDAALVAERESHLALEETRRALDRLAAGAAALRTSAAQHEEQRERLATARLGLAGARRELEARLQHAVKADSEAASRRRAQDEETVRLRAGLVAAREARNHLVAEADAARAAERKAQQELDGLRARLRSLRALVLSGEQLGAAASRLLEAARRKDPALLLSVRGAVGEAIAVDDGYERAAERLVGVHRIRLERAADLPRLIEEAGGEEAGPCEVLVSELVEASRASAGEAAGDGADGADRLRDHVAAADPNLGAAIPDAIVVPDLESALAGFRRRPALRVTRDGVSVAPPGVVHFGRGGPGEGFLAARREAEELADEEKARERRLAGLTAALSAAEQEAAAAGEALEERREALRGAEALAERLRLEGERSARTLAEVRRRREELAAESSFHAEDARRNEEASAQAAEALARDEKRFGETVRTLASRERALASARHKLGAAEQEWREADRELARQSAVADEIRREARAWERQAEDDARRLDQVVRERAALRREDERWKARRESALSARSTAASAIAEWEALETDGAAAAESLRARLEQAAEATRKRRAELAAVEERLTAARGEVSEARSLLAELESEFRRANGRELEEAAAGLPPALRGTSRDELAAELARWKEQIEKLGPVNEIAEARLRELEAERDGPAAQLGDVERGVADGLKAMERQDHDARRIFREGFEAVNTGFDEAFRQLFGGGRAELRLVEPKRPANGPADEGEAAGRAGNGEAATGAPPADERLGIEIAAEPPGKKLQSVRILSGGEKAMTAIAFLIALFRYRPAPFCLLDEVDAALDDANAQRFAALLGELRRDTQLVVITHNRLTMEACEHLYGVTMEEPGVSRLLSVQLGDERLEGWIDAAAAPASRSGLVVH